MPVDSVHPDYEANVARWRLVRDFLRGEDAIKKAGQTYLPKPQGREGIDSTTPGQMSEYDKYILRASVYDATAKTVEALVGAIFRKEPSYTVPAALDYLNDNADGSETPLPQLAKAVTREVSGLGRCGLLVDFPDVGKLESLATERELGARAQIFLYTTENIINWRFDREGAQTVLKMLVLREFFEKPNAEDPFVADIVVQYRVYELVESATEKAGDQELETSGVLQTTLYEKIDGKFVATNTSSPMLPGSKPLTYIPFVFLGAADLTCSVDKSPVLDIARINVAHYRNSADYEDGLFMLGQPTPYITGVSSEWAKQHGSDMIIGARTAWMLPEGATAGLLEMTNNMGALAAAMEHKEQQMASLGARLFDQRSGAVEAAETIRTRQSGEASILASIASNVSRAFKTSLMWVAAWMDAGEAELSFETNDDFFSARLTHNDMAELLKQFQAGTITYETLFQNFVAGEIIAEGSNVDDYQLELDAEKETKDAELPFSDEDLDAIDNAEDDDDDNEGALQPEA